MSASQTTPRPDLVFMVGAPVDDRTSRLAAAFEDRGIRVVAAVPELVFHEKRRELLGRGLQDLAPIKGQADNPLAIKNALNELLTRNSASVILPVCNDDMLGHGAHQFIRWATNDELRKRWPLDGKLATTRVVSPNADFDWPTKRVQRLRFADSDWAVPWTWIHSDSRKGTAQAEKFADTYGWPIIVKAYPGAGGNNVASVATPDELRATIDAFKVAPGHKGIPPTQMSVEQALHGGSNITVMGVAHPDGHVELLGWSKKYTRQGPLETVDPINGSLIRIPGAIGFSEVGYVIRAGETAPALVQRFAREVPGLAGFSAGAFHADAYMIGEGQHVRSISLIEASNRSSGHGVGEHLDAVAGVEIHEGWAASLLGEGSVERRSPRAAAYGVYNLTNDELPVALTRSRGWHGVEIKTSSGDPLYAAERVHNTPNQFLVQGNHRKVANAMAALDLALTVHHDMGYKPGVTRRTPLLGLLAFE